MESIWKSAWLTNGGPCLHGFLSKLSGYFSAPHLCLFNNGTQALQLGIQALELTGEVITTPFTFPATTHALALNGLSPVFVDIDPDTLGLDPEKVEAAITPRTSAILAVHVYGRPCRHRELSAVAERHGLKLLYDAAHAFGVTVDGASVASWGDLTMFSFHATKLFHSIEGGLVVCREAATAKRLGYLKNFGFESETEIVMAGTNAKMNEFQALMGSLVLDHIEELLARRRRLCGLYRELLSDVPGIRALSRPLPGVVGNGAYCAVRVEAGAFGMDRDALHERLKTYNVFTRRYFHPLLSDLPCYRDARRADGLDEARRAGAEALCLPLYHDLPESHVERICSMVRHLGRVS